MAHSYNAQEFSLILLDIATAAAASASGWQASLMPADGNYVPGCIRNTWLALEVEAGLRQRVNALANAGAASLAGVPVEQVTAAAERYGVPITGEVAERIVGYFKNKREAVMQYNR